MKNSRLIMLSANNGVIFCQKITNLRVLILNVCSQRFHMAVIQVLIYIVDNKFRLRQVMNMNEVIYELRREIKN